MIFLQTVLSIYSYSLRGGTCKLEKLIFKILIKWFHWKLQNMYSTLNPANGHRHNIVWQNYKSFSQYFYFWSTSKPYNSGQFPTLLIFYGKFLISDGFSWFSSIMTAFIWKRALRKWKNSFSISKRKMNEWMNEIWESILNSLLGVYLGQIT